MKKLKLIPGILLLSFGLLSSCDKSGEPVKDVQGILMAEPWYFFSINGNEAYDCNKQTQMQFHENGTLEINGYVREPDYTCSGPHLYKYQYVMRENNTKIEWEGEVFSIVKLTDTEFIKSVKRNGEDLVWVYKRYR